MSNTVLNAANVLAGFLVVSCGPNLLQPYKSIDPIPQGKGVVYVYHDPASFTPYAFTIKLDGKDLVALKPGAYYPFISNPGEVQLSASLETTASITVDVKAGQARYVRFYLTRGVMVNRPNLVEVSREAAEPSITECREAPPISK
jgi:Protein of unknown function (DUF2846)